MRHASYVLHIIPCAPPLFKPGLTLEATRLRWLPIFDALLDAMGKGLDTLTLSDGTAALELYLQLRPERYEQIEEAARSGRLWLPPWYIQPDFARHDLESIIRNLTLGLRTAEALGKHPISTFLPKWETLPAQIPQLLREAGIEGGIIPWESGLSQNENRLSGVDQNTLVAGCSLEIDSISTARDTLAENAITRHLALTITVTSFEDVESLRQMIQQARHATLDDIFQSTPDAYVRGIQSGAATLLLLKADMPSSNPVFERLLGLEERFAAQAGLKQPQQALVYAWKQALLNAPGCQDMLDSLSEMVTDDLTTPVSSDNPNFSVTAAKLPENSAEGVVVRGVYRGDAPDWVTLEFAQPVQQANVMTVLEGATGGTLLADENGRIRFQGWPGRVLTLYAQPRSTNPR